MMLRAGRYGSRERALLQIEGALAGWVLERDGIVWQEGPSTYARIPLSLIDPHGLMWFRHLRCWGALTA